MVKPISTPNVMRCVRTALAPQTTMISMAAVLSGCAAAACRDNFELLPAILCLAFVFIAQLYANMARNYYALKHNYADIVDDSGHTWRQRLMSVYSEIYKGLFWMSVMVGLALISLSGWWIIAVGVMIYCMGWMYCAPPLVLSRTPWGAVMVFLIYGPVEVIGTSLVQSQTGTITPFNEFDLAPAIILSVSVGLMAVMSHITLGMMTYREDILNSKRTLVVAFGPKWARRLYLALAVSAYVVMWGCVLLLDFRYPGWDMAVPSLWLVISVLIWWRLGRAGTAYERERLALGTMFNTFALWVITFVLFVYLGDSWAGPQFF